MRVIDRDTQAREAIVVDEALESLRDLAHALPTLQHLNVSFNNLASLCGIEEAVQLRNLNVTHNAIASLQEVAALSHLRVLKCSHNEITDLSWLVALDALQELFVQHNRIERAQIAHLRSLQQLTTLVLHPNPCTEQPSYIVDVVRTMPWLERLDMTVIDDALRATAQHASERETLSTGSTDCSLSLLTGRSDGDVMASTPPTPAHRAGLLAPSERPQPPAQTLEPVRKKKTKQEIAEEFMRNFPVQDYIPMEQQLEHTLESSSANIDRRHDGNEPFGTQSEAFSSPTQLSRDANSDGFLKKHASKPRAPASMSSKKQSKRPKSDASALSSGTDANVSQQDELLIAYPNSAVTAVHVRSDGSAIAKWPNGSVAVSVDRERDGFRVYAAHKDGAIALSLDAAGVGFINYYPSGKTMLSTTSSGDGLVFSSDGAAIVRQWDVSRRLRDEQFECIDALGSEANGSLLCKLSDGVGVCVQLAEPCENSSSSDPANPIQLTVYFATTGGIRYRFTNSVNVVGRCTSDACDCVFGPAAAARGVKRESANAPPAVPHADLFHDIRAAVASLSM